MKNVQRNQFVDIMRGIAMLLVVLGHTMTATARHSSDSFVYNVRWSLQMPLFILISGYVTRYGGAMDKARDLGRFLRRRTLAYLLPWATWTVLVRGIVYSGKAALSNLRTILWHMDSGYWFLITIWTVSVIYGVARFLSRKLRGGREDAGQFVLFTLFFAAGMAVLGGVGYFAGFSFFAVKLTLYRKESRP